MLVDHDINDNTGDKDIKSNDKGTPCRKGKDGDGSAVGWMQL